MALRNIFGITVGLAAALGGAALAARKLFGSDDTTDSQLPNSATTTPMPPLPPREGLDPTLLEILACPDDKEPVIYQKEGEAERLTCTKCGKRYPVRDGIPVMLIDEATPGPLPTQAEIDAWAPLGRPAEPRRLPPASQPARRSRAAAPRSSTTSTAPKPPSSTAASDSRPRPVRTRIGRHPAAWAA
jgi:uncharacterized protein